MFNSIYFFLPGISQKYQSGGLRVTQQIRSFFQELYPDALCQFVTTHEKIEGGLYVPEFLLAEKMLGDSKDRRILCVVTWGPLVHEHIALIRKNLPHAEILFYAQSFGWGIKVPASIPIVCVSRFVMSQWALYAKGNFVGYVPPALSENFTSSKEESMPGDRSIDALVHRRKQNTYCLEKILPALKKKDIQVHIIDKWIDQPEFAALLSKTKIFLYCTELHKAGFFRRLPGEGFGLPALEALASGCVVASNLFGGVTDFLTPGVNCVKIQTESVKKDVEAIEMALTNFVPRKDSQLLSEYSEESVKSMWQILLSKIM